MLMPPALSAVAALAAVVALVLLAARVARRSGFGTGHPAGSGRRLSVQDSLVLDRARRVLLVRCDGREVLIVTGGPADVVVGWLPGQGAQP